MNGTIWLYRHTIVDGSIPNEFTLRHIRQGISDYWDEQRRKSGFQYPTKCCSRRFLSSISHFPFSLIFGKWPLTNGNLHKSCILLIDLP